MFKILILFLFLFQIPIFAQNIKQIKILITTDLHGWYSSIFLFPNRKQYGIAHLKDTILKIRQANPHTILLDAGDLFFGSPMSIYAQDYNFKPEQIPFLQVLKNLNYDAVTLGNHDFEYYKETQKYMRYLHETTWLSANTQHQNKSIFPYKIINKAGIKIAILGLTTPSTKKWTKHKYQHLQFFDLEASTTYWINKIQRLEKPHFIIAMYHAGLNPFRGHVISQINDEPLSNSVLQTIKKVQGIDLVISGHDHRLNIKNNKKIPRLFNVPVISASFHGKHLIDLNLTFIDKKISDLSAKAIKPEQLQKNEIQSSFIDQFKVYLYQKTKWKRNKKTNLKAIMQCMNNTLAKEMMNSLQVEYAYFPSLKKSSVKKNQFITRQKLFQWIPYNNYGNTILLSGHDFDWLNKKQALLLANKKFIPQYHFYQNKKFQSESFQKNYKIVMNNYHAIGGGGILLNLLHNEPTILQQDTISIRERLFKHLSTTKPDQNLCSMFQLNP